MIFPCADVLEVYLAEGACMPVCTEIITFVLTDSHVKSSGVNDAHACLQNLYAVSHTVKGSCTLNQGS